MFVLAQLSGEGVFRASRVIAFAISSLDSRLYLLVDEVLSIVELGEELLHGDCVHGVRGLPCCVRASCHGIRREIFGLAKLRGLAFVA